MSIEGLSIIGESINDSVPSTGKLFEAGDMGGILALARSQDEGGAAYIDVNVGRRSPEMMARTVRSVQKVTGKPISVDTPDLEIARAGLTAYDQDRAGGRQPILNSISPLRAEMLKLLKTAPFHPILLISERVEGGEFKANQTAAEVYQTAQDLLAQARKAGLANNECILDPGIGPLASDLEGMLRRLMESLRLIHDDKEFAGIHISVGLSNFTHMLPSKRADGSPVRGPLESAFLTRAMPLGLDTVVGSVKRKYEMLADGHPALVCFDEMLKLEGYDALERLREFYAG